MMGLACLICCHVAQSIYHVFPLDYVNNKFTIVLSCLTRLVESSDGVISLKERMTLPSSQSQGSIVCGVRRAVTSQGRGSTRGLCYLPERVDTHALNQIPLIYQSISCHFTRWLQ